MPEILTAGSTNPLLYKPKVGGVVVELVSVPTVVITSDTRETISITGSPVWSSADQAYLLFIEASEIPVKHVGHIWEIAWSWVYDGEPFRDVERYTVGETGLSHLLNEFRRRIKDTGTATTEYFLGDGVTSSFTLKPGAVKPGSEQITSGNSVLTSGYTFDHDISALVFPTAPTSGVGLKAAYLSYFNDDVTLEDFLLDGIIYTNEALTLELSTTDPAPTARQKQLLMLFAMREFYICESLTKADSSFSWRSEEESVNKSGISGNYVRALEALDKKISLIIAEEVPLGTGTVLAGGTEPTAFGSVDWNA